MCRSKRFEWKEMGHPTQTITGLFFGLNQVMLRRHQGLVLNHCKTEQRQKYLDHCKNDHEKEDALHGASDRLLLPGHHTLPVGN